MLAVPETFTKMEKMNALINRCFDVEQKNEDFGPILVKKTLKNPGLGR